MLHYRRRHSLRRSQRKARRMGCSVPGKKKNHSMTSASSTAGNSQSASARRAMVLTSSATRLRRAHIAPQPTQLQRASGQSGDRGQRRDGGRRARGILCPPCGTAGRWPPPVVPPRPMRCLPQQAAYRTGPSSGKLKPPHRQPLKRRIQGQRLDRERASIGTSGVRERDLLVANGFSGRQPPRGAHRRRAAVCQS
jgi:hypothetical protein